MNPSCCFSPFRLARAALFASLFAPAAALAADAFDPAPAVVPQARCKSLGEGFHAVKDSDACVKISGYIAAGVEFAEPGRVAGAAAGPFAPRAVSATDTRVDTRYESELGPGRLYLQVGRDHVQP